MRKEVTKSVIIIDENLPRGVIANTAAILGMTLGKRKPELIGGDTFDKDSSIHLGITEIPIPVLMSDSKKLQELRTKLYEEAYEELIVIDFSSLAQSCKIYEEYTKKMSETKRGDLVYWGVAIYGEMKIVNKLTGGFPLLR